jgi:hypothetical protein
VGTELARNEINDKLLLLRIILQFLWRLV